MKKIVLTLISILVLFLFLFSSTCFAVDITLKWNPNTEDDIAGYKLFERIDNGTYDYNNPVATITHPTVTATTTNRNLKAKYSYVVRVFDNEVPSLESGDSNEASYTVTSDGPPANPSGLGCFINTVLGYLNPTNWGNSLKIDSVTESSGV